MILPANLAAETFHINTMSETTEIPGEMPRIYPDEPEKPAGPALPAAQPFHPSAGGDGAKEQEQRERAFDAEYEWNGKPLKALSLDRESLFLQLRTAVGAGDIMTAVRDFDGFLADVSSSGRRWGQGTS